MKCRPAFQRHAKIHCRLTTPEAVLTLSFHAADSRKFNIPSTGLARAARVGMMCWDEMQFRASKALHIHANLISHPRVIFCIMIERGRQDKCVCTTVIATQRTMTQAPSYIEGRESRSAGDRIFLMKFSPYIPVRNWCSWSLPVGMVAPNSRHVASSSCVAFTCGVGVAESLFHSVQSI